MTVIDASKWESYYNARKQSLEVYDTYCDGYEDALDHVDDWMDAQPTIDAVPVVRCKDCKHFKYYKRTALCVDGKSVPAGWCSRRTRYDEDIRMLPDDFCSYGERKDT